MERPASSGEGGECQKRGAIRLTKAEGGRQKAEGRRQKAEGRRQKAEGRRQKVACPRWQPRQGRHWKVAPGATQGIRAGRSEPLQGWTEGHRNRAGVLSRCLVAGAAKARSTHWSSVHPYRGSEHRNLAPRVAPGATLPVRPCRGCQRGQATFCLPPSAFISHIERAPGTRLSAHRKPTPADCITAERGSGMDGGRPCPYCDDPETGLSCESSASLGRSRSSLSLKFTSTRFQSWLAR